MNKRALIFDGRNLLWRTYSVFKTLSVDLPNGKTISTGGIFGFLSHASVKWRKYGGRVMVAWEGDNNFRHALFPGYKKKDKDVVKEELMKSIDVQERRLKKILMSMGVEQYKAVGGEADDALATLATRHIEKDNSNVAMIYTGDSDLRQMVGNGIAVISPGNNGKDIEYVTEDDVVNKDLVKPNLIPDLKALSGDTSDKIPGIAGIGDATAFKLLNAFGDVSGTIKAARTPNSDWPVSERFRQLIADSAHDLKLYKILATVNPNDGIELIAPKKNKKQLLKYLRLYRFVSLLDPLELQSLVRMGLDEDE